MGYSLARDIRNWEEDALLVLLARVYSIRRIGEGEDKDKMRWNLSRSALFR